MLDHRSRNMDILEPMASSKSKTAKAKKTVKVVSALQKKSVKKLAKNVVKAASKVTATLKKAVVPVAAKPGKKEAAQAVPAKGKGAKVAAAAPVTTATKAAPAKGGKKGKFASPVVTIGKGPSPDIVCREPACEHLATTGGYCRQCYIKNWKKIKRKELILREKKLNRYIEELVSKYPDKYLDVIRQDLSTEKEFAKVILDLELDESVDEFDVDNESVEVIDNIKRDFEGEDEGF